MKNTTLVWLNFVFLNHKRKARQPTKQLVCQLALWNRRANLRDQQLDNFQRTRRNLSNNNLDRAAFWYDCNTDCILTFAALVQWTLFLSIVMHWSIPEKRQDCAVLVGKWNCHYWLHIIHHLSYEIITKGNETRYYWY